jgi:RNA polymerase sigma-70 factor (ECF subfamily)
MKTGAVVLAELEAVEGRNEFEVFFLQHYSRIYRVLYRITRDPAEAEDLALETFLRLWRHAPSGLENTGGWLSRVALRLGFNSLRSRKRRFHYEEQASGQEWLRRLGPDPQKTAEQNALARAVHKTLNAMRSRDAHLLILHHTGYSYREIADALNLNPNSIGVMLARAEREFERIHGKGD